MLGHHRNTSEATREMISIPPKIEPVLLAFAKADTIWLFMTNTVTARAVSLTTNLDHQIEQPLNFTSWLMKA